MPIVGRGRGAFAGSTLERALVVMTSHRIGPWGALPWKRLGAAGSRCYRAEMYTVGRFLQIVGLTILPLAILSELNHTNPGLMLKFMLIGAGIFMLGYLFQRYSGGKA
jgi:hypothetical protein